MPQKDLTWDVTRKGCKSKRCQEDKGDLERHIKGRTIWWGAATTWNPKKSYHRIVYECPTPLSFRQVSQTWNGCAPGLPEASWFGKSSALSFSSCALSTEPLNSYCYDVVKPRPPQYRHHGYTCHILLEQNRPRGSVAGVLTAMIIDPSRSNARQGALIQGAFSTPQFLRLNLEPGTCSFWVGHMVLHVKPRVLFSMGPVWMELMR